LLHTNTHLVVRSHYFIFHSGTTLCELIRVKEKWKTEEYEI
jgi:hypothetical protein